jgi:hypothetical protein
LQRARASPERGRPTRSPFPRPAIQTLERLHSESGGQILASAP